MVVRVDNLVKRYGAKAALGGVSLEVAPGVLLRGTIWGRQVYAVGGNEVAARYSGLPVSRIKIGVYAFSGSIPLRRSGRSTVTFQ